MSEMVPLSSIMTKDQYNTFMFMMSRPRFDASPSVNVAAKVKDDFLGKVANAEARDDAKLRNYVAYQRSQREPVHTGGASQPVGGRAARAHRMAMSERENTWTEEDEAAYRKAFKKSSTAR